MDEAAIWGIDMARVEHERMREFWAFHERNSRLVPGRLVGGWLCRFLDVHVVFQRSIKLELVTKPTFRCWEGRASHLNGYISHQRIHSLNTI